MCRAAGKVPAPAWPLLLPLHTKARGWRGMDFGYACLSVMVKEASCAQTVTVKRALSLPDDDARQELCRRVARSNLLNTRRLVFHNAAHGLRLYRITPQLVPLATHDLMAEWRWQEELEADFRELGQTLRAYGLRISSHPGQYTVLNSTRKPVQEAAIRDLNYHADLMDLLGYGAEARIVIHVGGAQGGKEAALGRFLEGVEQLPDRVRSRLAVENDDTLFHVDDVLQLCRQGGLPMVLDIHHDLINPGERPLDPDRVAAIFATWPAGERPKIHVSSPRDQQDPKAHADYVDPAFVRGFLDLAAGHDFDIMVEAKQKDAAALKLAQDLGITLPRIEPVAEARV